MMMKKLLYIWGIGLLFCLSCQKNEMMIYDGDNYIQFIKTSKDTNTFSFSFYPELNDYEFPVVLEMSGSACKTETSYRVVVDKEETTAEEGKHFVLPEKLTFKVGAYRDTCLVKLMRREEMKKGNLRIVLRIEENASFKQGEENKLVAVLLVNDKLSQPKWWDDKVSWYYLGTYSDEKYELFIQATKQYDLTGADEGMLRYYSLMFKYWLQDEGRTDISVPVKG